MSVVLEPQSLPLQTDSTGTIRVGGTRVPLETVVACFQQGASAEEIVLRFPVLKLPDVYTVIGYYLVNRSTLDEYLQSRAVEAQQIQEKLEAEFDPSGIRQRLLSRP